MLFVKYDWDLKHGLWCILFWFLSEKNGTFFIYLHAWFTNRYGCLCRGYLKVIFFYDGGLNLGDFVNSISQWFYDKEWLLILTVTVYYFLCRRRKLWETGSSKRCVMWCYQCLYFCFDSCDKLCVDGIDVKSYFLTALIPDKGFKKTIQILKLCVWGTSG